MAKSNLLLPNNRVNTTDANDIIDNLNIIARSLRNILIDDNKEMKEAELKRIMDSRKIIGDTLEKLDKALQDKESRVQLKEVADARFIYEAARAGKAGKGFAVVANEIKELARQTAAATVDIKNQIGDMQTTTATTVEDIGKISEVIADITRDIASINQQLTQVEEGSGHVQKSAQSLSDLAAQLENLVKRFKV